VEIEKPLLDPPPPGCVQMPSIGDKPINAKDDFPTPNDVIYVCCVLTGDWPGATKEARDRCEDIGAHYVQCLYEMVSRYMPHGTNWRFICFTDRRKIDGVPTAPIEPGLYQYFSKLYCFKEGHFPPGARVLYFDLDTCVVGPLKDLLTVPLDRNLVMLRDVWAQHMPASGVMSWKATPTTARIWEDFAPWIGRRPPFQHPNPRQFPNRETSPMVSIRTDEHWLHHYTMWDDWYAWQNLLSGQFLSYKYQVMGLTLPSGRKAAETLTSEAARAARIIYFHGRPRPHEVVQRWNPFWRGIMDAPAPMVTAGRVSSGI
jgi:hypothetical protein